METMRFFFCKVFSRISSWADGQTDRRIASWYWNTVLRTKASVDEFIKLNVVALKRTDDLIGQL